MSTHRLLSGQQLHEPYHYVQEADPGAVGAGKYWLVVSTGVLRRRNDADTDWNFLGGGAYDYARRDAINTFLFRNIFTANVQIQTTAVTDPLAISGDGDVTVGNTGIMEINGPSAVNVQAVTNFNNQVYVNGALVLTQAVTSAQAVGITGLTGGGATKLDGIASATAIGRIVLYYNGSGLEMWMLLNETHPEDGTVYIQPDDNATLSWVHLG